MDEVCIQAKKLGSLVNRATNPSEHIKIDFAVWGKGYVADAGYWNHFFIYYDCAIGASTCTAI
jgi:hypothetical protein